MATEYAAAIIARNGCSRSHSIPPPTITMPMQRGRSGFIPGGRKIGCAPVVMRTILSQSQRADRIVRIAISTPAQAREPVAERGVLRLVEFLRRVCDKPFEILGGSGGVA